MLPSPHGTGPGPIAGAFSFILFVAFVPWLKSPAITPRWALLAAFIPLCAALMPHRGFTLLHGLGLAFTGWCAVTLAWTPNLGQGVGALAELILFGCLFHIGAALPSLRPVYIGAALGLGVNSLVALVQAAGFEPVAHLEGFPGLFMNKNHLAAPAALVLIGLIGHRLWQYVPLVIPAAVLPFSKSAFVALAAVGAGALWRRSVLAALAAVAVGELLVCLAWSNQSAAERLVIWTAMLPNLTPFGTGIGSFRTLFPGHAPAFDFLLSRPTHAHNDWLEFVYETGVGAMLAAAFLIVLLRAGPWTERAIVAAFIMEGCFDFPIHLPATVFIAGLAAGHLARSRVGLREWADARGMALFKGLGFHVTPDAGDAAALCRARPDVPG